MGAAGGGCGAHTGGLGETPRCQVKDFTGDYRKLLKIKYGGRRQEISFQNINLWQCAQCIEGYESGNELMSDNNQMS